MKPKTVTTIKYIGILLFLICVFQEPQEASAKYVSGQGRGADFHVYEYVLDDYTEQIVVEAIGSSNTIASFVVSASNGKEYLVVGYNGTVFFRLNKYSGGTKFNVEQPYGLSVFERMDGHWVLIQQKNKNGTVETDIPLGDTTIYVIREYTKRDITVFSTGIVLFSPSEPTILPPTPSPTPTPPPSPTNTPVINIDANDAGLTEIFDAVIRIMNIPFCINGYEITFLQIFIYIALASGVLYLIFGGTRD